MDEYSLSPRLRQLLVIAGVLVALFCAYTLVMTLITYRTTAVLHIDSSDPQATISVSQVNHEAKSVGTGKGSVRLKPGTYQAMASNGRNRAVKTVSVSAHQSADVSLKLSSLPAIRSVDDVRFDGMNIFLESGRTEDQISTLELDFFRFNTSARVVSVDGDSLTPAPRNSKSDPFSSTFTVTIDSKPYTGKITYSGSRDIDMTLYNPDGSTAFDSTLSSSKTSSEKFE